MTQQIRIDAPAIPTHEVLFVFKDGLTGMNNFLDCVGECLGGFDHRVMKEDCVYIRLKEGVKKGDFYSIIGEFMSDGRFNSHLFSKKQIASTAARLVGWDCTHYSSIYHPTERNYKKIQRYLLR